jgi:hypothetical protein
MSFTARREHPAVTRLTELVQELLDAHCDTICLSQAVDHDPAWASHLHYLQDLQRAGQATLAELS